MGGRGSCRAKFSASREIGKSAGQEGNDCRMAIGECLAADSDWRLATGEAEEITSVASGLIPDGS